LMIGVALLTQLPLDYERELEIEADIEEKHGQKPETASL